MLNFDPGDGARGGEETGPVQWRGLNFDQGDGEQGGVGKQDREREGKERGGNGNEGEYEKPTCC